MYWIQSVDGGSVLDMGEERRRITGRKRSRRQHRASSKSSHCLAPWRWRTSCRWVSQRRSIRCITQASSCGFSHWQVSNTSRARVPATQHTPPGDKLHTAIKIGFICNLLKQDMEIMIISADSMAEGTCLQIEAGLNKIASVLGPPSLDPCK